MNLDTAAKATISHARALGLAHVDVMVERSEEMEAQIRDGKVEKVEQSTSLGLGVRVLDEGRSGFASTERLDEKSLQRVVRKARDNAEFQDPTEVVMPEATQPLVSAESLGLYNPELTRLGIEDLSRMGLEIEAAARNADSRVTAIPYLGVSRTETEKMLWSTHGTDHYERGNSVSAYCGTLLEEGNQRKSGFELWSRREWDENAGSNIGREAARKGAELLEAKSIPSETMPVVIDEHCTPRLLGMYFRAFHGEAAQKGTSRLKDRLGEEISIAELTVIDDPYTEGGRGSRAMDAEGTPTRPLTLVENGVFRNFLYHVEPARREGLESTGHASRGYNTGISTRIHNMIFPLGGNSLEELCALPERCLLVTQLEGMAGCNPISGDISIGVQGFLISNGKRVQPVDSVTIAGNFFELLKKVRAFGNRVQPNLTRYYIPALLVDGFSVSA